MTKYLNVLAAFYGSKWAIVESWHSNIEGILRERALGVELSAEQIQERIDARDYRTSEPAQPSSTTAVIQLYGPIIPRANLMTEYSGGATHTGFAKAIREAADDDTVNEIVLDISSPGGTVEGMSTSAEAMRYAASKKPVTAVTEGMLCSAAYWLASQADRIVAAPTAQIGSIGVVYKHVDATKLEEGLGIKSTFFRSGPKKQLGNPSEALSEEAAAELQREIDELYDVFLNDVAAGRGRTKKQVKDEWGDGAVYATARALELGLIDEQGTLHSVLNGAAPTTSPKRRRGGRKASAMEENMTLEELKAENPTLYEALMAQARAEAEATARAEGHAAGLEEGRTQAAQNAPKSGGNSTLQDEVVRLRQTVERQQEETRAEKRKNIASSALERAALPKAGIVGEFDLDAEFRGDVERVALEAATDDDAKKAVDSKIAHRKAVMGVREQREAEQQPKHSPRPMVPVGDNSRQDDDGKTPKSDGMKAVRAEQGLYN